MKKIVAIILTLCIVLSFVGCAESTVDDGYDSNYYDDNYYQDDHTYEPDTNAKTNYTESANTNTNANNYTQPKNDNQSSYTESANTNTNANNYTQPKNDNQSSYSSKDTTVTSKETTPSYEENQSQAHTHTWREATCTEKKTCTTCGKTTGSRTAHDYAPATCTQSATCRVCGDTTGSRLAHNYASATCTKPETCTLCGNTRGIAGEHEYFNDTCSKCGNKITIPFTVEYNTDMSFTIFGETTYFTIEQYNIEEVDKLGDGYCELLVTIRNQSGGSYYYLITFYDANGRVLSEGTYFGSGGAGSTETDKTFIPINTAKIVIRPTD